MAQNASFRSFRTEVPGSLNSGNSGPSADSASAQITVQNSSFGSFRQMPGPVNSGKSGRRLWRGLPGELL
eukprot:10871209-Alexandrium_andersonii.AAC.1